MSTPTTHPAAGFRELMYSDLARYRSVSRPTALHLLIYCATIPGMLASLVLRTQQSATRRGRMRTANAMRMVGTILLGADFGPSTDIGTGLMMVHPNGIVLGGGVVIGNNVSMAAGVTAAARSPRDPGPARFAVIGDDVVLGSHAVLVGGVHIGRNATVGANAVVLTDVPADSVAVGAPARIVGRSSPVVS